MKFVVEIWPLFRAPSRNEAISSPVSAFNVPFWPPTLFAFEGYAVSFRAKFISPCGKGTWKNGNWIGLISPPNLKEWFPLVIETF